MTNVFFNCENRRLTREFSAGLSRRLVKTPNCWCWSGPEAASAYSFSIVLWAGSTRLVVTGNNPVSVIECGRPPQRKSLVSRTEKQNDKRWLVSQVFPLWLIRTNVVANVRSLGAGAS